MAFCAAFSIACGDESVLDPTRSVSPEAPAQTDGTATPPGLTRLAIEGVYDLAARVTDFDPAWGDLTSYRYGGVLTFEHDSRYGPGIGGTFADLHGVLPTGEREAWERNGNITSYFHDGEIVIELVDEYFHFTLMPTDTIGYEPVFTLEGRFGTGGHIGGRFATQLQPEVEREPGLASLRGVVRLGELPLADVSVVLHGPAVLSAPTGANGDYAFLDLPAGDYTVGVIPPPGHSCGNVAHLALEAGGSSVHDVVCSKMEDAWIISYALTETRSAFSCFYGESIVQTTVFTLEGPNLTATFNHLGIPDIYGPNRVTMTGPYDRPTGRYEAASSPIIVSLGIGYEPDPLIESWRVEFLEPSLDGSSASLQGVATLSSEKYGTCDFHITGHGKAF